MWRKLRERTRSRRHSKTNPPAAIPSTNYDEHIENLTKNLNVSSSSTPTNTNQQQQQQQSQPQQQPQLSSDISPSPQVTRSSSLPHTPVETQQNDTPTQTTVTTADISIPPATSSNTVTLTTNENNTNIIKHLSANPNFISNPHPGSTASPTTTTTSHQQQLVLPLPPPSSVNDRYRRLSLDGDLPPGAIRPDAKSSLDGQSAAITSTFNNNNAQRGATVGDEDDDEVIPEDDVHSEGVFDVDTNTMNNSSFDVAACSKPGWEPMRGSLNIPATHTVEVRKENQDAYCVFVPFTSTFPVDDNEISIDAQQLSSNFTSNNGNMKPTQMFLGVFDGHGAEGRPIAHYARDFISVVCRDAAPHLGCSVSNSIAATTEDHQSSKVSNNINNLKHFSSNLRTDATAHRARLDTLRAAFSRAERALTESGCGIDHVFSGTTAVVCWIFGNELYTAWTGDSRSVIGRSLHSDNIEKYKAVDTSYDQKPSRNDEKKRVRAAGGRIARWQRNMGPLRVWLPRDWTPGLAMTRSIGDTVLSEYGVSPVPEVSYTRLNANDSFIVLASDGVWEFMTSQEVVDFVGKLKNEGKSANEVSDRLVSEAVKRWRRNEVVVDDTTAVIMYLQNGDNEVTDLSTPNFTQADVTGTSSSAGGEKLLLSKSRHLLSRTMRGKMSLKGGGAVGSGANPGVYMVSDSGHLTDYVCKNDSFQGL